MPNTLNIRKDYIAFAIPILMILSLVILIKSSFFVSKLTPFVLIDLLLTIPLVYFLLIRKREISNTSVFSVAAIGLLIASLTLPKEEQLLVNQIRMIALPIVEVLLIGYVIVKLRKALQNIKTLRAQALDFFDLLEQVCNEILPKKIGHLLAVEISVLYYGLWNWRRRKLRQNEFTYHKEGTANSVMLGFLLVILVEIFVTHSMIQHGNDKGALILGVLSAYTALQIIAMMKSLAKRPIFIDTDKRELVLKFGILAKAIIPFEAIESVEIHTKDLPEDKSITYLSPLGSATGHNMVLRVKEEAQLNSIYGFMKRYTALAFFVDEKQEFKNTLSNLIVEQ